MSGEGNYNSQPPSENHPGNENIVAERVGPIVTKTDKLPFSNYDITLRGLSSSSRDNRSCLQILLISYNSVFT
ncbi:hypothetical protein TNCV_4149611 [Trichonephila clavipes]|uniref:Uncharacterized protein n=1 Tax=Trichonephila clavipes TaxID=2585209 RepID=A0A8X7BEG4_TRICX|nr:hypothetical protein TNCV_4149611 [Trichonephila clavipes]